jgi:6-oxo-cyclohex-1-ene-carbonyl-CoA hydrolase
MESCTLCEVWSAYEAERYGLVNGVERVLKEDGEWIADPRVITDHWLDEEGRLAHGKVKQGEALAESKQRLRACEVDFSRLDARVEELAWKLALTMPDCTTKTIESLRKHKLQHWHRNRESNRAWLALNMATEAKAGFPAFHFGERGDREVDFLDVRRRLAAGEPWTDELIAAVSPPRKPQGKKERT